MAQIQIKMPDDFLFKISALAEKTDEIVPVVLEAGGNVVLDRVRSNLAGVIGKELKNKSRSTGELLDALGLSPPNVNRRGNWDIKIGFDEPRSGGGTPNAKIANVIEYGKHGQPAKPFLKPAKTATAKSCIDAMKAKLEEEIGKI